MPTEHIYQVIVAAQQGKTITEADLRAALDQSHREGAARAMPEWIAIRIASLPKLGHDNPLWWARRNAVDVGVNPSHPSYDLDGDPNAVAVGRFKASLRKFLGVD